MPDGRDGLNLKKVLRHLARLENAAQSALAPAFRLLCSLLSARQRKYALRAASLPLAARKLWSGLEGVLLNTPKASPRSICPYAVLSMSGPGAAPRHRIGLMRPMRSLAAVLLRCSSLCSPTDICFGAKSEPPKHLSLRLMVNVGAGCSTEAPNGTYATDEIDSCGASRRGSLCSPTDSCFGAKNEPPKHLSLRLMVNVGAGCSTEASKSPTTILRGCLSPRRPGDYPPACQSRPGRYSSNQSMLIGPLPLAYHAALENSQSSARST